MSSGGEASPVLAGARFEISGEVQGVGFRWWARRRARELGIVGSIRNRSDGSVEVIAAGPHPQLDEFERALETGPPGARVAHVARTPEPANRAASFEIVG
jgi:acylphosphatase